MDRHLIPAPSAAPETTRGLPMTDAETKRVELLDERVRELDLWRVEHEAKCTERHRAIGVRFDTAKDEMVTEFKLSMLQIKTMIDKSNGLRLIGMTALGILVVLVGIKQPAALFELLAKMP